MYNLLDRSYSFIRNPFILIFGLPAYCFYNSKEYVADFFPIVIKIQTCSRLLIYNYSHRKY